MTVRLLSSSVPAFRPLSAASRWRRLLMGTPEPELGDPVNWICQTKSKTRHRSPPRRRHLSVVPTRKRRRSLNMWSRRHETCARLRHQIHTAIGSPDRRGGAQHVGEYHIEPLRPVRGAAARYLSTRRVVERGGNPNGLDGARRRSRCCGGDRSTHGQAKLAQHKSGDRRVLTDLREPGSGIDRGLAS